MAKASVLPAPKGLNEARKYVGYKISREFQIGDTRKDFLGECTDVADDLCDDQGNVFNAILYHIQYEDGDEDDIEFEDFFNLHLRFLQMHERQQGTAGDSGGKKRRRNAALDPDTGPTVEEAVRPLKKGRVKEPQPDPPAGPRGIKREASEEEQTPGVLLDTDTGAQEDERRAAGRRKHRKHAADGEALESSPPLADVHEDAAGADDGDERNNFVLRAEGRAGQLHKIKLVNFMCHQNFEMEFGNHVTLVSGTNGSGKSAVMQALQLCLGVKAAHTGRANKAASFIRSGSHYTEVAIVLWNTGPDAYKPQEYGGTIRLERKWTLAANNSTTSCTTKLYGEKCGQVRKASTTETGNEVKAMLEHFNVDGANPLTIITQDMSRMFLAGGKGDAAKKYDMFMRGTLLMEISDALAIAHQNVEVAYMHVKQYMKDVGKDEAELREVEERYMELKNMDSHKKARAVLECAIMWMTVHEEEQKMEETRTSLEDTVPTVLRGLRGVCDKIDGELRKLDQVEADTTEQARAYKEILATFKDQQRRLQAEQRDAHRRMVVACNAVKPLEDSLQAMRHDREELNKQLQADHSGKAAEARRRLEELQAQLRVYKEEVDKHHAAQQAAQEEANALSAELEELAATKHGLEQQAEHAHRTVRGMEQTLSDLAQAQGNKLMKFGGHAMVRLKEAIADSRRRFSQVPIGPVGYHLSLVDDRWARMSELALGSTFMTFLCANANDIGLLRELARSCGMPVDKLNFVSMNLNAPPHAVPPGRLPVGVDPTTSKPWSTIMDVITIEEYGQPVRTPIMNYLIDRWHVENMVITVREDIGRQVMHGAAGEHIRVCWSATGVKYNRGLGTYAEPFHHRHVNPRLAVDEANQVAQLQEAIQEEKRKAADLGERLRQVRQQEADIRAACAQAGQRQKASNAAKIKAMTALQRANVGVQSQQQSLAAEAEDDEALQTMQTQIADLSRDEIVIEASISKAKEEARTACEEHAAAQARVAEYRETCQAKSEEFATLRNVLTQVAAKRGSCMTTKNNTLTEIEGAELQLCQLKAKLDLAQQMVKTSTEQALRVCPRPEGEAAIAEGKVLFRAHVRDLVKEQHKRPGSGGPLNDDMLEATTDTTFNTYWNVVAIDKRIGKLSKQIQAAEERAGGSLEELEERRNKLLHKVEKARVVRNHQWQRMQLLSSSLQRRVVAYDKLRETTVRLTQEKFSAYMKRRDHTGRIIMDHEAQELKLQVKIKGRIDKNVAAVEDLKQLSGGERSYTTVSFLLAVGHNTESPFRCMDEFDVFMDAVNRRVATETLLEFAYDNHSHQYIFLTPQDLQAVEDARKHLAARRKVMLPPAFLKTVQMRPARE